MLKTFEIPKQTFCFTKYKKATFQNLFLKNCFSEPFSKALSKHSPNFHS